MKKSPRKLAVANADKWFSLFIRQYTKNKYGACPFCGKEIEHCFHFFSRVAYSTRWLATNAIGSCSACNMRMEYAPYDFYRWYVKEFSQEMLDEVNKLHHTIVKFSTYEIEEKSEEFRKLYLEVKGDK